MPEPENIKTLVTEREDGPVDGSVLRTPSGQANLTVVTQSWWMQVLIRVARTYTQGLVGFIVAGTAGLPGPLPAAGFGTILLNAASLSIAPAVVSLLQNGVEILARLDATNPGIRA